MLHWTDIKKFITAWFKALRIFSLGIALHSCLLGLAIAFSDGYVNWLNSAIVLFCGLALQAGVNLVNDFFEYKQNIVEDKIPALQIFGTKRKILEWLIFLSGLACFAAAIPGGLYLVWKTGPPLLILGIIGFLGGFFYTGEPFNYKRRGLAVFFVFFLMGVFMITGSYYAVAAIWKWEVVFISIPLSALVSHVLLGNEIRDHESDAGFNIKTFTVRFGINAAAKLFYILLGIAYLGPVVLYFTGLFPHLFFVFLGMPFLIKPFRAPWFPKEKRKKIIPLLVIHHFIYGAGFILTYIFDFKT